MKGALCGPSHLAWCPTSISLSWNKGHTYNWAGTHPYISLHSSVHSYGTIVVQYIQGPNYSGPRPVFKAKTAPPSHQLVHKIGHSNPPHNVVKGAHSQPPQIRYGGHPAMSTVSYCSLRLPCVVIGTAAVDMLYHTKKNNNG